MDGFQSNVTPESSSTQSMSGQRPSGAIPPWDEVLDDPMRHRQQMSRQQEKQYQNIQSRQSFTFSEQTPMPSTMQVQDPYQNQMGPQELQNQLQYQNLQSTQHYPLGPSGQMPLPEDELYFQNQLSPYHLQHPNLQSTQPFASYRPRHWPPTFWNPASLQYQGHLHSGMMHHIPQHPVAQQQYQQHGQQQTYQPQLPLQAPLHPIPPALPHTSMSMNPPTPSIPGPQKPKKRVDRKSKEPNPEEKKKEEMREFAELFRKRRILLGISEEALSLELQEMFGQGVRKEHICRFERFEMSFQDMREFKPLLESWMEKMETSLRNAYSSEDAPKTPYLHFKHDRAISSNKITVLRESFQKNQNPCVEEIEELAKSLSIDQLSVTLWFYNGRRIRKMYTPETGC